MVANRRTLCSLLLGTLLPCCGGSSSETPYPLEPKPQAQEQGTDQKEEEAEQEASEPNAKGESLEQGSDASSR